MNQMASPAAGWADKNSVSLQPPSPGPRNEWQPPESAPEFIALWRAIAQRKWSIFSLTVLACAAAWLVVAQIQPTYRGTATVLLEAAPNRVISQIQDVVPGTSATREHIQTQAEVMKGREIAQRVINRLDLLNNPELDPRQQATPGWKKLVVEAAPSAVSALFVNDADLDESAAREKLLRSFAERLTVDPVRLSQLVRVRFDAQDPALAARIANAVAEAYIAQERENKIEVTTGAGDWIRERMAELKRKLDKSEAALQAYRDKEGLLDSKTTVLSGSGRQLDELTNRLVEAGVQRSLAEEAYKQVKAGEGSLESVPAVIRSPSVQNAKAVENELSKRLAEVSQRYGPEHPRNIAAAAELKTAQQNTQKEIRAVVDSLIREYQSALATEKNIEGQLRESKGTIQTLNRKELQLSALEREAATNRQLYETFLTRYGETSATRDAQQANARIVERAVAPIKPVSPQKLTAIVGAGVVTFLLSVLLAVLLARFNSNVKTSSDVETKLQVPFLAALPVIGFARKKRAALTVIDYPDELYAEGIRTATTGLMLSGLDIPRKIIAVTSSLPGEGKTTTSLNLALSQAKSRSTILVEADLRRPSVLKSLGLSDGLLGVSDFLAGTASAEQVTLQVEGTQLKVIPCGTNPPDPLSLVSSEAFRSFLAALQKQYEMVIVDCPPVQVVSDALLLGSLATGVVYVVKADDTPVATARTGIRRLTEAGARVIGVMLNQHDHRRAYKYYGERYGYGRYSYKGYGYAKRA